MSEKKTKETTPEELTEAMDEQVRAANADPSTLVIGDPNDGGHVTVEGHGWSDEEAAARAWTGEEGTENPLTTPVVEVETGTKSTKSK